MNIKEYKNILLITIFSLCFFATYSLAADLSNEKTNRLMLEEFQLTKALEQSAMPELYPSKLGQILTRHYNEGLGGFEKWKQLKSLRMKGMIETAEGESYQYESLLKKPNYLKMVMFQEEGDYVLAFDGVNAREKSPLSNEAVLLNPGDPKFRLIQQSAQFGSYLLYPFSSKKNMEYLGTERKAGSVCHWIRVELDTHFILDYFIDVKTYKEVQVVLKDLLNPVNQSLIHYSNYKMINGFPIAHEIRSEKFGEWASILTIDSVDTNVGSLHWMFDISL
jgi:hypothetical protein